MATFLKAYFIKRMKKEMMKTTIQNMLQIMKIQLYKSVPPMPEVFFSDQISCTDIFKGREHTSLANTGFGNGYRESKHTV